MSVIYFQSNNDHIFTLKLVAVVFQLYKLIIDKINQ